MSDENKAVITKLFQDYSVIFEALLSDLKANLTKHTGEDVTVIFFRTKIGLVAQKISKLVTVLCVAFSAPPLPTKEECVPHLKNLQKMCMALVNTFYSLPLILGLTLRKLAHEAAIDVLSAVHQFVQAIPTAGFVTYHEHRRRTGNIWELCEKFPKLPEENSVAIMRVVCDIKLLLDDAIDEIKDAIEECDLEGLDPDDLIGLPYWSDHERQLIAPSMGVIKCVLAVIRKCAAVVSAREDEMLVEIVKAMDDLCDLLRGASPLIDDFITVLYPPVDVATYNQNVKDLAAFCENILKFLRESPLTTDTDEPWLDSLDTEVSHNKDKALEIIPDD